MKNTIICGIFFFVYLVLLVSNIDYPIKEILFEMYPFLLIGITVNLIYLFRKYGSSTYFWANFILSGFFIFIVSTLNNINPYVAP
jgi:hypothetical protein